jgi:hypothetical protein
MTSSTPRWLRKKQAFQTERWLQSNAMPCPRCGVQTERISGCETVTCFYCEQRFENPRLSLYDNSSTLKKNLMLPVLSLAQVVGRCMLLFSVVTSILIIMYSIVLKYPRGFFNTKEEARQLDDFVFFVFLVVPSVTCSYYSCCQWFSQLDTTEKKK